MHRIGAGPPVRSDLRLTNLRFTMVVTAVAVFKIYLFSLVASFKVKPSIYMTFEMKLAK